MFEILTNISQYFDTKACLAPGVRVSNGSTRDSVKRGKVIFFPPCFTYSKMLRQSEYSCKCFQIQRLRAEEKHNEMFGLMLAIVLLFQKFQLFHQSRNNITCWLK